MTISSPYCSFTKIMLLPMCDLICSVIYFVFGLRWVYHSQFQLHEWCRVHSCWIPPKNCCILVKPSPFDIITKNSFEDFPLRNQNFSIFTTFLVHKFSQIFSPLFFSFHRFISSQTRKNCHKRVWILVCIGNIFLSIRSLLEGYLISF